ncbi:Xaa-Pro aminopeptidase [bacterium HR33]|nr:Xaa-Pro aminopeptidase [bacterium HR33]
MGRLLFLISSLQILWFEPRAVQLPSTRFHEPVAVSETARSQAPFPAARRSRLLARVDRGVIVIPAASTADFEAQWLRGIEFRQDDYFFYLAGLDSPDAWLVMAKNPPFESVMLFLPPRDPAEERWTGPKLGPGPEASVLSGIAEVHPTTALDSILGVLLRRTGGPVYTTLPPPAAARRFPAVLRETASGLRDITPVLDSLRLIKDADEIERLRKAIAITAEAQKAAMRAVRPGMWEYQLEAIVEFTFRYMGATRVGFPSIVGSGSNTTILHYDKNLRQMQDGDLVLVDIGAEYGQYTADVTRTFPVNGTFSPRQRALYLLVLGAQQAALDAVRPGVTMAELDRIARRYLREHSGDLCAPANCAEFFIHGLGHWLGMNVHDVGDYRTPLAPGMVLTVEPGVYLPDEGLGIRIEDDVLVTDTGYELLSAGAPRTPEEIEALMKENPRYLCCPEER